MFAISGNQQSFGPMLNNPTQSQKNHRKELLSYVLGGVALVGGLMVARKNHWLGWGKTKKAAKENVQSDLITLI